MAVVSPLGCFIYSETPSDHFYSLANNYDCEATNYAEPHRDHGLKSDNDLRGLIKAGHCYKPTLERLPIDLKSDDPACLELDLSSADSIRSSQKGVSSDAHGLPLSEPCSSPESEQGRGGQDASLVPRDTRPPRLPRLTEPPLLAAIRQVLSSDPSYAEDVICAVNQFPHDKRSLSIESEPEPSDDPGAGRGTGRGRGGQGAGDKDDRESQDGSGRGDPPRPTRDVNMEKRRRWVCPYALAYPHLRHIPMFRHCWPGNMTEVHLWRDHLAKHHSPIDPNANPPPQADPAQFHMNPEQWEMVYNKIENRGKKRPRDKNEWFSHWKNIFLEVWRIIFPQSQFPSLDEPSSPFHLNSDETTELQRQVKEVLRSLRDARAKRAVESKAIASREDFRPSNAELDDMMSEAINVVLLSTPVAFDATHRLAHTSQTPQTTSAGHTDTVGPHPETALQDVPSETHAYTPTTADGASGFAPVDSNTAQTASTDSFIAPLRLSPNGTRVVIVLRPYDDCNLQTGAQRGKLRLYLPVSFYAKDFSQESLPTPPTPNILANPPPSAMDLDPGISQQPPTGPHGLQGISMQDIQGGPFGPEELAVMDHLGRMGQ
ncbi:uncharacterized protein NECHADRAFT_88278 [Fusarium vanettenii 77-13-4]|uniref:Uncharacterized protein n=1 Tax=Fusarium vanettenii (strain ATCC MYA-4622 / CBS 123669 / FGSC 9596 / NRRL 45880 / 77-13-4) TaxID=660122 RepID=C7ZE10_FUSV7|nr:uncharacterized protein NECHADRAFT_88278 [Fusarium vanettenii 77-13-4]EEU37825.1 hypothetical protein NECHADRAFT_88278 [Fusarium vanettenii 77-13-4]